MRTPSLLALSLLLAATLAATPAVNADPLDIQTGPCPEGEGMTLDVGGNRVQDCQPPLVWHCSGIVSVAGHCIQVRAAPVAPEAGARVCHGHNPGIQAWALDFDTGCREFPNPPRAAPFASPVGTDTGRPAPIERCEGPGGFAVRLNEPLPPSECTLVLRAQPCWDGTYEVAALGLVTVGRCPTCCPGPTADSAATTTTAAGPPLLEVRQCDFWGNSVVVLGIYESPCITTGCGETCMASDAPPEVEVRPCPPRGIQVFVNDDPVTGCIGTQGAPVVIDMDCNHPDNGVRVVVLDVFTTRCFPLPHGV